jgi:hypothetical protein
LIEASIVPVEHLDIFWRWVEPILKPAAEESRGRYLVGDVYNYILDGSMVLWVAHDESRIIGAAVTNKVDYPQKSVLSVGFWGGIEPLESYGPPLLELLQKYARETGCVNIEGYGRTGWSRRLKDYGYIKSHEVFELPI